MDVFGQPGGTIITGWPRITLGSPGATMPVRTAPKLYETDVERPEIGATPPPIAKPHCSDRAVSAGGAGRGEAVRFPGCRQGAVPGLVGDDPVGRPAEVGVRDEAGSKAVGE